MTFQVQDWHLDLSIHCSRNRLREKLDSLTRNLLLYLPFEWVGPRQPPPSTRGLVALSSPVMRDSNAMNEFGAPGQRLPSITVITPCRNGEPYVAEALESVARQGYPGLEHILLDACSTDNTLALVSHRCRLYKAAATRPSSIG